MRDRIAVGMRELRLDGGCVGVELEEPRGLAVGAGSAVDEAELLVESRSYSLLFGTEELTGPSGGGRAEESTSHSASGAAFGPCPRVTS